MERLNESFDEIAKGKWKETEIEEIVGKYTVKGKPTEEEILALEPGRELSILVAKYVMGHDVVADKLFGDMERLIDKDGSSVWNDLRHYSEDRSAAQEVIVEMVKRGYDTQLFWGSYENGAYAPAEAICKRALLLLLVKEG